MKWECISGCGACCKVMNGQAQTPEIQRMFSIFNRGDGVCRLLIDNRCSEYEQRPEICRVQRDKHTDEELIKACDFVRGLDSA